MPSLHRLENSLGTGAKIAPVLNEMIMNQGMIQMETPVGTIQARVIPDEDYPGISLALLRNDGGGSPGAVLEYTPVERRGVLRVYEKDDPDGDPIRNYAMSEIVQPEKP